MIRSWEELSDHLKADGQKVIITGREECGELPQGLGHKHLISRIQTEGKRTEGKG